MSFYDEVEIEDFEFDSETETYVYPCPCGDQFQITIVSSIRYLLVYLTKYQVDRFTVL